MPRGKATQSATTKATRATRSSKRDKPADEDDDWSTPSELSFTSRPAKKLHYSLDALLQEKANAPPSPPKKEEESDEEETEKDLEMTEAEKEEGISLLTSEGFTSTAQVREILHFDDELKRLDQYLDLLRRPYTPPPMVPTFATPHSPRGKGLKRQNSSNLEDAHEQALKAICRMFAEESPVQTTSSVEAAESDSENEESEDLPYLETTVDIAADGITLYALLQPVNDYLQTNDWIEGTTQHTTCREIAAWLLSIIAFHPHTTTAGSIFSLFSRLLLGAHNPLPGISSNISLTPSLPRPRSCSFWANLLTPSAFYQIWKAYGVDFVGIVELNTYLDAKDNPFFPLSSSTSLSTTLFPPSSTSTTTTSTSSTPTSSTPTDETSSSPAPPNSKSSPKTKKTKTNTKSKPKRGKSKNNSQESTENNDTKQLVPDKQQPKPPTFPKFNFILTTQLLQTCTELRPNSFSEEALRTLISQTFQFLLDEKTSSNPSLIHLFESLLCTYLKLPLGHKRNYEYTFEQQLLMGRLCAEISGASGAHRVWVRAVETIPITSTPCVHLRILLALHFLKSLASSYLIPTPPTIPTLPSPFTSSYLSDLPPFLCTVLDGEYEDDAVLLSVVQLVELNLGPELGLAKNSPKEFEKLVKALQTMNKRVKDAGLFGLVRTRAKDHLVFMVGMLDGKKEKIDL